MHACVVPGLAWRAGAPLTKLPLRMCAACLHDIFDDMGPYHEWITREKPDVFVKEHLLPAFGACMRS